METPSLSELTICYNNQQIECKAAYESLSELNEFVSATFNLDQFELEYDEDDNERITIRHDNDLNQAIQTKYPKIYVVEKNTEQNIPLPPVQNNQDLQLSIKALQEYRKSLALANQQIKVLQLQNTALIEACQKANIDVDDILNKITDTSSLNSLNQQLPFQEKSDEEIISHQMDVFTSQQQQINQEIKSNLDQQYLPLHRFTPEDICNKIKCWMYNDINYKRNLQSTMDILSNDGLSG
eukprot:214097_1